MDQLTFEECSALLKKYGLPFIRSTFLSSLKGARKASKKQEYPIAMKVFSPGIIHKMKEGFVLPSIASPKEFLKSYILLSRRIRKKGIANASIVAQRNIRGMEFIIGAKRDQSFGPVVLFGLGGSYAEALKKISMRITPLSREEAAEMVWEIGGKMVDAFIRKKIVGILMKASKLLEKEKISEMDLNPIMASKEGVFLVDVRMFK